MLVQLDCDVVVAGAGLSGLCAALAAARAGQRVVLAGDRPVLGGNASSEVRMWTRGATGGGNLFGEEMGILGELKMRNLLTNPKGNPMYWDEVLLEAALGEPNLTLLLNTHIVEVAMSGDKIEAVEGFQLGSERRYRLRGRCFIDATGDGTLGAAAGVPYYFGEGSEPITGPDMDGQAKPVLGSSIYYFIKRCDEPVPFIAPEYAYSMEHIQRVIDKGGRIVDEKHSGADYWWFEFGGTKNTISDAQEIAIELKKFALGVWNYIKNSGKFEADNLTLEWIGSVAGKRESRRMMADYMLTLDDVLTGRDHPDAAFYGGWFLDNHPSDGIYSQDEFCVQQPVRCYSVPLRCLFSGRVPNLLFAGRIIGVSRGAFASTRVMNTCALSGQAAGTLAAHCLERGVTPAEAAASAEQAEAIRQRLLKDDMWVLGARNVDEADMARAAKLSASGWLKAWTPEPDGLFALDQQSFVCFPAAATAKSAELLLDVRKRTELEIELHACALPSRRCAGAPLYVRRIVVNPGEPLCIELPERAEDCFFLAYIAPNPDVSVRTGAWAPAGFLMGARESMNHHYPCVRVALGDLYAPERATDGHSRPYAAPHLWVAETKEAWLRLDWEQPVTIREARLYLNPDLSKELPNTFAPVWSEHHMMAGRQGWPSELAGDFRLMALVNGEWVQIAEARNNWRRLWTCVLEAPVQTTALRIDFHSDGARGNVPAQLFELRIY